MKRALVVILLVPALALAQSTTPPAPESSQPPASGAPASPTAPAATATAAKPATNPLANAVQARTPEEQARQSGFQLFTSLDHYLGTGTFVDATAYSSLSAWLTIVPRYLFSIGKQRIVASATLRGIWEYTMPDNETGRRWSTWDTRLSVAAPALFREKLTKIAFTPNIGVVVPTSLESWNAGLITSVSAGVVMSRSIGVVDFQANVSGARAFYGQPYSGVRNPDPTGTNDAAGRDASGNRTVVCRPGESICGFGGMNPAWTLSAGGQIQWRATGSFLLYAGFTYIRLWRYAATETVDAYTPKASDVNGNPVAKPGSGSFDRTSAFIGGSYQLNEHYSLDLGVSTVQQPLTPTGQVRFPLFSIGTTADNTTSIYFTLTAAY